MKFTVIVDQAAFKKTVVKQSRKFIKGVMKAIIAQMRALMRQAKTGRVYAYRGKRYRASAPGEAPAIRSRMLFKSMRDYFADDQTGVIEVDTPYAALLEDGTKFMAPRPYARPAIKTVREQFQRGGLSGLAN
jgi:hypothetical protein